MIKNKIQQVFSQSIFKLREMIRSLDTQLGTNSNTSSSKYFSGAHINIPMINKVEESKESKSVDVKKSKSSTKDNLYDDVDLRVGRVAEIKNMENSVDIYLLKVDVGEAELREIGTGLRKYVKEEEFKNRDLIIFSNLKPKKLGSKLILLMISYFF